MKGVHISQLLKAIQKGGKDRRTHLSLKPVLARKRKIERIVVMTTSVNALPYG